MLKELLSTLPKACGVYCMMDAQGNVLYVGKAGSIQKRVQSYTHTERLPHRLRRMVSLIADVQVIVTQTEVEALLLEANLIKKYRPPYNILLKDDKTMTSIVLTDHPFPLLLKQRHPKKCLFSFGPFPAAGHVDNTLVSLHKAFLLRSCSDATFANRKRPCLQYAIKRCSAPCVGKIDARGYAELVEGAVAVLQGKSQDIQKQLALKMQECSAEQQYEKARIYRDRIQALTQIQAHQTIHKAALDNADVLAIAQQGSLHCVQLFCFRYGTNYGAEHFFFTSEEGPEVVLSAFVQQFYQEVEPPAQVLLSIPIADHALLSLAFKEKFGLTVRFVFPQRGDNRLIIEHALENARQALHRRNTQLLKEEGIWKEIGHLFHTKKVPERIEVYDNSHLRGTYPVSAMIVATVEGFQKRAYRYLSMEGTCEDDYAMMRAIMEKRKKMGDLPDLMIIDGGKGHLSSVLGIIGTACTVIGMAKGPDRKSDVFYQEGHEPRVLDKTSPVLYALQRLRDEAHRFAITKHRKKREKAALTSRLEGIPGIGAKRRQALLQHFGTYKAVTDARVENLMQVPGISKERARIIYDFFQKKK